MRNDNPKIAPTKPATKPGTKPGRVSPIPRREPSVKPAPKAFSFENVIEEEAPKLTEVERIRELLIEQHGHMYEEQRGNFFQTTPEPVKRKVRPFLENMPLVMDIWFQFLIKNEIKDTSYWLFSQVLQGLFVDQRGQVIVVDFSEQQYVALYNSKRPLDEVTKPVKKVAKAVVKKAPAKKVAKKVAKKKAPVKKAKTVKAVSKKKITSNEKAKGSKKSR